MKQRYVVVSRDLQDKVEMKLYTNFMDACAAQLGMLVDEPLEHVKTTLREPELLKIQQNLDKYGKDRLCDNYKEVYMFLLPARDKF